ncbi:uncharacterized protein LOC141673327 [Apium graveolens]|uniref:uncharacterized protein LOC141673327 n=1 Tax=Apium graveolens TaxID=4045 RepID=UPI003D79CDE4
MKINGIVSNIRALGKTVVESYVVKKLLCVVPPNLLHILSIQEQFGNLDTILIKEVIGALKAHEERLKGFVTTNDVQLMLMEEEWRKRDYEGEKLRVTREEWMKWSNKGISTRTSGQKRCGTRDKSQVRCLNYGILGHNMDKCKKPRQAREFKQEVSIAKVENDEPTLLLEKFERNEKNQVVLNKVEVTMNREVGGESNTWYVDNGASNHMTGDKSKFNVLNAEVSGNLSDGGNRVEISANLLRVYDYHAKLLMKVPMSNNRLYKIDIETCDKVCMLSKSEDISWLWHMHLGHVNFHAMELMSKNKMSDAFGFFKKFQVKVEKGKRVKIGMFRTDRGGEIMSKEFISYYGH